MKYFKTIAGICYVLTIILVVIGYKDIAKKILIIPTVSMIFNLIQHYFPPTEPTLGLVDTILYYLDTPINEL